MAVSAAQGPLGTGTWLRHWGHHFRQCVRATLDSGSLHLGPPLVTLGCYHAGSQRLGTGIWWRGSLGERIFKHQVMAK